jgi:WD40 repeat protein
MLFNSPMKYTRILSRQSSYRLQLWRQNSSYLETSDGTSKVLTINDGDSLNNDHGVTQQTSRCCRKFRHRRLRGYNGSVYSVVFTPDGKGLVSGSLGKILKYEDISGLVVGRVQQQGVRGWE